MLQICRGIRSSIRQQHLFTLVPMQGLCPCKTKQELHRTKIKQSNFFFLKFASLTQHISGYDTRYHGATNRVDSDNEMLMFQLSNLLNAKNSKTKCLPVVLLLWLWFGFAFVPIINFIDSSRQFVHQEMEHITSKPIPS